MQRPRQAKKTIHGSINDIRDHAGGMSSSIGDIGEVVKDVFIEKLRDVLRGVLSLRDRGQEAASDAAEEVRDDLEETTQEQPYKTILIAAGLGLILGFVLRRR